ncbi:MAG TPA: saccharopine dehydrogenase, partial [Umezawaea sp.]|nr:saccharopine dehydrogenase [Umezawaea sp.]
GQLQAVFAPLLRTPLVQHLGKALAQRISGPNENARGRSRSEFWGEVSDVDGHTVSIAMTGPNGYDLTADAVLRAVDLLLVGGVPAGAHTPSSAFGADFVRTLDGVTIDEPVRT